jgi:hypothetical protein
MRDWRPDDRSDASRLLLVEDEPSLRTLAKWLLEQEGFQVTDVASSAEALRVLSEVDLELLVGRYPDARHERTGTGVGDESRASGNADRVYARLAASGLLRFYGWPLLICRKAVFGASSREQSSTGSRRSCR